MFDLFLLDCKWKVFMSSAKFKLIKFVLSSESQFIVIHPELLRGYKHILRRLLLSF